MKLFVDIGNSAVKWATDEELVCGVIHQAPSQDLPDSVATAWQQMSTPSRVHVSSVLKGGRLADLTSWMSRYWKLTPAMAEARAEELGVVNGYRLPTQLGVDRWLALLATRAVTVAPVIVVDCGSATTIDAMDASGRHLGGVILPGLRLLARCLLANTDIPAVQSSEAVDYFATDTATGIESGAMLATAASVEWMQGLLREKNGTAADCLLTGGNAELVSGHLATPHRLVPNLVLQGLALQAGRLD
jgi:type III pantothenate kinase